MKKLLIEQKAKAYDEAIRKAKITLDCCDSASIATKNTVYDIFPELKESEDEKIRKELIAIFKRKIPYTPYTSEEDAKMYIAWLEKQGNIPKKATCTREVEVGNGNIKALVTEKIPIDKVEPKFKVGDKIYLKPEYRMPNDDTPIANTVKEIIGIDDELYRFKGAYIFIEDQDKYELVEQKPADKVEPKFHEGDWVILTAGELSTTLQIVNVDINKKLYWFNDGSYLPIVDEECLHHWTIQDAKDGDVLVHNSITFIFKGIENGIVKGICTELSDTILNFGEPEYDNDYCPATKEQRDALFAKMKEAGYKLDAEKKGSKKIDSPVLSNSLNTGKNEQEPIIIDVDKMVSKYSQTNENGFGLPVSCQIRAYRQGINDALRLALDLESAKLTTTELENKGNNGGISSNSTT